MQALWLENQALEMRDVPVPEPVDGQALIKVSLAGICSTDLELVRGYYPFSGIPGHEFVGRVVSSPSDASWEGKCVVGEINIACGNCEMCQLGVPRHCMHRKTLGIHEWQGAFTEYLVLPLSNLHQVPETLTDEVAVFTEPTAAACEILEQIEIRPKDHLLIIGAGRLGQLLAQVLNTTQCDLTVVIRHQKQKELLRRQNILSKTIDEITSAKYDIVIEATGSSEGLLLAKELIRPRGKIVLKSTYKGEISLNLSPFVVDEITLIGSRCGSFQPAVQLLSDGRVNPLPLIDAVYPLKQAVEAFTHASQPGVFKILIKSEL
jgi:2-desacetyl-2-hydroxyethyl bacteriochlorophyllide A dehydrogenase